MLNGLIQRAVGSAIDKAEHPVGVCLSGGVDSSTVAAFAQWLPMFTGWYKGEPYDERRWAELAKGKWWTPVQITPTDFIRVFDRVREALRGLRCGPGAIGQYVVAEEAARQGIKTLLTGEGGDELFGGYVRLYKVAGKPLPDGYENLTLPDDYPRWLGGALDYEWNNLRELCQVDERIAGAHGIKVIPPLLDPWVVAWAMQHPPEARLGKRLLKEAMRGVVHDKILDRTDKRGFPVPFVEWAQEEPLRSFVKNRIGYVPDPAKPWDRGWWYDLLDGRCLAADDVLAA